MQIDAPQVEQPPVQLQATADDRDRADPAVGEVSAEAPAARVRERERRRVQLRVAGGPQRRVRDPDRPVRRPGAMRRDRRRPEAQPLTAVGPGQAHLLPRAGHVADEHLLLDVRVALRTRVERADLDLRQVGGLHRPQVDLAQDPPVVPPLSARTGREVGGGAAVVDAQNQSVDAAAQSGQVELPRQIGAGVAADLASVQPHGRAVVDRLEADDPVPVGLGHVARERAGRKREVAAVPADVAVHARLREIAGVVGVGNRGRRPAGGRGDVPPPPLGEADVRGVGAVEPGPPEQVAAGLPVAVPSALGRRLGAVRGSLRMGDPARAEREHERQDQRAPDHLPPEPGFPPAAIFT